MRALALAAALLAPSLAGAQVACGDHAALTASLRDRYGETRQSIALDANGAVVETYASSETGTWSLLVTRPGGGTCMIASGESFELTPEPQGEPT